MLIELTYTYSELDEEPQFGLVIENDNSIQYIHWVWFYLGKYLGDAEVIIYPFSLNRTSDLKPYKRYKYCNNAQRQAKLLHNAIIKKI